VLLVHRSPRAPLSKERALLLDQPSTSPCSGLHAQPPRKRDSLSGCWRWNASRCACSFCWMLLARQIADRAVAEHRGQARAHHDQRSCAKFQAVFKVGLDEDR
jgi:hypothetical protein